MNPCEIVLLRFSRTLPFGKFSQHCWKLMYYKEGAKSRIYWLIALLYLAICPLCSEITPSTSDTMSRSKGVIMLV